MTPSDYTVQEHIADLRRIAAHERLAREVRNQPNIVTRWLNRLFAALRRYERHPQPGIKPALPLAARAGTAAVPPELRIDEAWF